MPSLKALCQGVLGAWGMALAHIAFDVGSRPIAYQLPPRLLRPELALALQATDRRTLNHGLQATLVNQTDSPLSVWHPDEPWGCASLFFVVRRNFIQPLDTLRPRSCIDWEFELNTPFVARLQPRQAKVYDRSLLNWNSITQWSIGDLFQVQDSLRLHIKAVFQNGPLRQGAPFDPWMYFEHRTVNTAYWRHEIPADFWRGSIESPWISLLVLSDSAQTDPCMAPQPPEPDCRDFKPIGFMDARDWRALKRRLP